RVQFPHGALLALGGRSSPECTVLRWAISWAFLCGVCMLYPGLQCSCGVSPGAFCVEFACSPRVHKGFPPLRTPTEKTCKITEHMMDSSLHLVPGRYKLPTAPGRSLRKDGPGWGKKLKINSPRPQSYLRVCVCVLCRLHICTCGFQSVVCVPLKTFVVCCCLLLFLCVSVYDCV